MLYGHSQNYNFQKAATHNLIILYYNKLKIVKLLDFKNI